MLEKAEMLEPSAIIVDTLINLFSMHALGTDVQ
jgi:hypothetical protein